MNLIQESSIITNNLWWLYTDVAKLSGINYVETSYYLYVKMHLSPWPNFIFKVRSEKFTDELVGNEIVPLIINRKIPSLILLSPLNEVADSIILNRNGFKQVAKWPGMILNLDTCIPIQMKGDNDKIKYSDCAVSIISGSKQIENWFKVIEYNLFSSKSFSPSFFELAASPQFLFWELCFNGKIIGTTLIYIKENIAGCYMVSINNEYKGLGLATFMLKEIILYLKQNGITHLVLQANSQSENLYSRLGFKKIGNFDIFWKMGIL